MSEIKISKKRLKLHEKIISLAAQLTHEKHLYYIGLRTNKPSPNQLYKVVSEYIFSWLEEIKNKYNVRFIKIDNKKSITIDERIVDVMKPTIFEYAVYQHSFFIESGNKYRYTITTSGIIKEGDAKRLPQGFLEEYISILVSINELLEYGCILGINQLNYTGTLYIDEKLVEFFEKYANNRVAALFDEDVEEDTEIFNHIQTIVELFIDDQINVYFGVNIENKDRPIFYLDSIESKDGTSTVVVAYLDDKYTIANYTGNQPNEKIIDTLFSFATAINTIFANMIQVLLKERI